MKVRKKLNVLSCLEGKFNADIDGQFLSEIAIILWRIKNSLQSENPDIAELEQKRSWKHLQRLFSLLESKGIIILDKTGAVYDAGMALRVISSEKRADLKSEIIIETITPTVFHNSNIIHVGEIIVGKPAEKSDQ